MIFDIFCPPLIISQLKRHKWCIMFVAKYACFVVMGAFMCEYAVTVWCFDSMCVISNGFLCFLFNYGISSYTQFNVLFVFHLFCLVPVKTTVTEIYPLPLLKFGN